MTGESAANVATTTPPRDAAMPGSSFDRLVALVATLGLTSVGTLDEMVYDLCHEAAARRYNGGAAADLSDNDAYDQLHDNADAEASAINNGGITRQVAHLLAAYGAAELTRLLSSAAEAKRS